MNKYIDTLLAIALTIMTIILALYAYKIVSSSINDCNCKPQKNPFFTCP